MKALLALLLLSGIAHAKPTIATVDETLANGLHVIVAPDSTVNSIGVLTRHEDCAAALAQPAGIDDALDQIEGFATTSLEPSHFDTYTQVPAGGLELALWFEAKRMTHPVLAPPTAPSDDDYSKIDAAIEDAVRARATVASNEADRCVAPARTTIAIVGRIDAAAAMGLARKYFAPFVKSQLVARTPLRLSTTKSIKLVGSSATKIVAWPIERASEAVAMVAVRVLAMNGIESELRDDELRVIGRASDGIAKLLRFVSVTDRRVVDTNLLARLETLRYRATVLASGRDVDKLRADIARISDEDLGAFVATLAKTPSVTLEVTLPVMP